MDETTAYGRLDPLLRQRMIEAEKCLNDSQVACLRAIASAGVEGLTCEAVEDLTGLPHTTASARIGELARPPYSLVRRRGIRRPTRPKREGAKPRTADVWILYKE